MKPIRRLDRAATPLRAGSEIHDGIAEGSLSRSELSDEVGVLVARQALAHASQDGGQVAANKRR
jgi:hypothetical protein